MWVIRLNDKQLEVLRALIRSQDHLGPSLQGALESLDFARWDDLPEADLPWDQVADAARRQNISEADVIWDLCGGQPAVAGAKPARRSRAKKRGRAVSKKQKRGT